MPAPSSPGSERRRFTPRISDVYIATYPRSGTSLVQMLLYQITTDGELRFEHISQVIPFLERSLRNGDSLESLDAPRIFKTHLPYRQVSRWPGKYIYVAREGKDVLLSNFHLFRDYVNPLATFPAYFEDFLCGRVQYGSWFRHVAEWGVHRADSNVLYLRYEDLLSRFDDQVGKIAAFCGYPISEATRARIRERCSFEFMRRNERKFAPEDPPAGLKAEDSVGRFIRSGLAGGWRGQLTQDQVAAFDRTAANYFPHLK